MGYLITIARECPERGADSHPFFILPLLSPGKSTGLPRELLLDSTGVNSNGLDLNSQYIEAVPKYRELVAEARVFNYKYQLVTNWPVFCSLLR